MRCPEKRNEEDHDEEREKELSDEIEDDSYVLAKASDVMHALFGTHKDATLPYFEQLLPHLSRLLQPARTYSDRQWAICMFDDVLEYATAHSVKYQQYFLSPLLLGLADKAPEVRQAAAYGFGVMGMLGENAYAQACAGQILASGIVRICSCYRCVLFVQKRFLRWVV